VEELDARITPCAAFAGPPAFHGLNVTVERISPTDPTLTASPVFALNYGTADAWTGHAMAGLNVAVERFIPTDPRLTASPVFVGLNGSGSVDAPA
jgi:hypothetical protein